MPYYYATCSSNTSYEIKNGKKKSACVILFINYKFHGCICFITLSQIPSRSLIKTELCNHTPNHCNKLLNMERIRSAGRIRHREDIRRCGFITIRIFMSNKLEIVSMHPVVSGESRSVRKPPVIEFLWISAAPERGTADHKVREDNKRFVFSA